MAFVRYLRRRLILTSTTLFFFTSSPPEALYSQDSSGFLALTMTITLLGNPEMMASVREILVQQASFLEDGPLSISISSFKSCFWCDLCHSCHRIVVFLGAIPLTLFSYQLPRLFSSINNKERHKRSITTSTTKHRFFSSLLLGAIGSSQSFSCKSISGSKYAGTS